jgi:hypothetical protein
MKKFYSLIGIAMLLCQASYSQSPTTVFVSSDCNFVRDFNSSDEGFSSPSIYADDENTSFYWSASTGALIETSNLTVRDGSVISPMFLNTMSGQTIVGFSYVAPAGSQYRIRVISGTVGGLLEIVATTANGPVWDPLPSTSGTMCLLLSDVDILPGAALRYEISFRASQGADISFDNFALNTLQAPLPVTFLGFVAKRNDDGSTKLLWNVADEINVNKYVVERSSNGTNFTAIGTVTATGKPNYSLEDNSLLTETRYYRVKNVDIDGASKYTPVVKVIGNKMLGSQIQLYPMPATDQVYVQHDKAPAQGNITIYSLDGKMIKRVKAIPNTYQTNVNTSDMKTGMYVVKYDDGTGQMQSAKLIKR